MALTWIVRGLEAAAHLVQPVGELVAKIRAQRARNKQAEKDASRDEQIRNHYWKNDRRRPW
jgi:DNA-binding response OmpR family regulator